jgi:hypothetical protein
MKKWILITGLLMGWSCTLYAATGQVWISSTTATANTTQRLCPQLFSTNIGHGIFHGVCVNEPISGLSGTLTVFNSSATTDNSISTITTNGSTTGSLPGCVFYDVAFSSGLSYTTVSTAAVTMLYSCQ